MTEMDESKYYNSSEVEKIISFYCSAKFKTRKRQKIMTNLAISKITIMIYSVNYVCLPALLKM